MFLSRARTVLSRLRVGALICNGGALPKFGPAFRFAVLALTVLAALGYCWLHAADTQPAALKTLSIDEFDRLRPTKQFVVLDCRKPGAFARGHIPDAINIDLTEKDLTEKLAALDRHHPYVIHASDEQHATETCERLAKLQLDKVYSLQGGFDAWRDAGKPVEKNSSESDPKN